MAALLSVLAQLASLSVEECNKRGWTGDAFILVLRHILVVVLQCWTFIDVAGRRNESGHESLIRASWRRVAVWRKGNLNTAVPTKEAAGRQNAWHHLSGYDRSAALVFPRLGPSNSQRPSLCTRHVKIR